MTNRQFLLILVPFLFLIVTGFLLYPEKDRTPGSDKPGGIRQTVTIAMVGKDAQQTRSDLKPFVEFINQFLEGREFRLRPYVANSEHALQTAVLNGEVDVYLNSPFSIYTAVKSGKMRAVARQWRDGVEEYHSVILARRGAPARSIEDLDRLTIAFEDRSSSCSYLLPAAILCEAGYMLMESVPIEAESIGPYLNFRFSGGNQTSLNWLLGAEVDLAAVNSIDYREMSPDTKAEVRIIHESPGIPRHLVAVRSTLDPEIEEAVLAILINMETSSKGRTVLKQFYDTRRFDSIPRESELKKRMFDNLENIPCEP